MSSREDFINQRDYDAQQSKTNRLSAEDLKVLGELKTTTMKQIITIKSKGLFTDRDFLQARELTVEDFTFTTRRTELPKDAEDFKWHTNVYHTLTGTMSESCVQELNSYSFFGSGRGDDVNELSADQKHDATSRGVDVRVPIDLTTDKGGKVKSLSKKLERMKLAKEKLDNLIENKEDMVRFIAVEIGRFNERIADIVTRHNKEIEGVIRKNLTSRSSLEEIVELNKENFNKDELESVSDFDQNVTEIDKEIKDLKRRMEEAEKLKSEEYIKLSKVVYKGELPGLPDELRGKIEALYENVDTFSEAQGSLRPRHFSGH